MEEEAERTTSVSGAKAAKAYLASHVGGGEDDDLDEALVAAMLEADLENSGVPPTCGLHVMPNPAELAAVEVLVARLIQLRCNPQARVAWCADRRLSGLGRLFDGHCPAMGWQGTAEGKGGSRMGLTKGLARPRRCCARLLGLACCRLRAQAKVSGVG